jgi:hypothetical protein
VGTRRRIRFGDIGEILRQSQDLIERRSITDETAVDQFPPGAFEDGGGEIEFGADGSV